MPSLLAELAWKRGKNSVLELVRDCGQCKTYADFQYEEKVHTRQMALSLFSWFYKKQAEGFGAGLCVGWQQVGSDDAKI